MPSSIKLVVLAAILSSRVILAQPVEKESRTEIVSLRLHRPTPSSSQLIFGQPGVQLAIVVSQPGQHLVSIDHQASKLESFTDDQGTDLTIDTNARGGRIAARPWISPFPKFSNDHSAVALELQAPGSPSPKARELLVKAKVVLKTGSDPKTVEHKSVKLAAGTVVNAGPVAMTITSVHPTTDGDSAKLEVSVTTKVAFEAIQKIGFFTAEGREIKHIQSGRSISTGPAGTSQSLIFALHEKVDDVNIKITYFETLATIEVPLDLKVDVGL